MIITPEGWRELSPVDIVWATDCYFEKDKPFKQTAVKPIRVGKTYAEFRCNTLNDNLIIVRPGKRRLPLNAYHSQPAPLP